MALAPPAALNRLRRSPAGERLVELWGSRWIGGPAKVVLAFVVLIGVLEGVLRNNAPPPGVLVFGAIVGLLYAMVAFGLILVYRANRIINFAQAEIGAVPAVMAVLLIKVDHVPYLLAFVIAMGSAIVAGALIEFVIMRRFQKASRLVGSV